MGGRGGHVKQDIFLKRTLIDGCSLHLYASFGTFSVKIILGSESLNIKLRSTTFSFDHSDLSIFKHTSKTHCTVVEGAEKSQNDLLAFSGRFGYEKTDGRGIFHEFGQNNGFS